MVRWKFDHTLILLRLNGGGGIHFKKRFHFENTWLLELELNDVVELGWSHLNGQNFLSKLSITSAEMNSWGNQIRGKYCTKIVEVRTKMEQTREMNDIHST